MKLTDSLKAELVAELKTELKEELKEDLRRGLKDGIKEQLSEDRREKLKAELKQELQQQIREQVKAEEKDDTIRFEEIREDEKREHLELDLDAHYERAFSELGLQQTKRDQLITLYLAMFSFLIPFALSMEGISLQIKGLIFLVAAIVGILFAFIIIRYRIYKEVYWLCCQSLTVLHNIRPEKINKEMVQRIYYYSLKKKGKSFMVEKDGQSYFSNKVYVQKNLFSSESIYFFIHCLLTVLIFGLSIGLILPGNVIARVVVSIVAGVFLFFLLSAKYFSECVKVYSVMVDHTHKTFNTTFSKAWFLHFDV